MSLVAPDLLLNGSYDGGGDEKSSLASAQPQRKVGE